MNDTIRYLVELRKRLLQSILVLGAVCIVLSFYANKIYQLLAMPLLKHLAGSGLIATAVPAPFLIPFKSALVLSVFITVPYFFYQLWQFVAPALYDHEKKIIWLLLLTSSLLFYGGTIFAYFAVLPIMFKFFIYVAPEGVEVKPDISLYFSFVMQMFFAFGLSFELPVLIVLLTKFNIFSIQSVANKRPYVIVGAFVIGMLLTPPDVISQVLLAIPLWLLFELGLLLSRWVEHFSLKAKTIT